MRPGQELYPINSLDRTKNMAFSPKNLDICVDFNEYSHPIQTTTYPPFTKGT